MLRPGRRYLIVLSGYYVLSINCHQPGVEIVETPDQNATDFTKCLKLVIERLQRNKAEVLHCCKVNLK